MRQLLLQIAYAKIENHQIVFKINSFSTVSIGIAQLQPQQNDLNLLIKNADIALYKPEKWT